MGAGPDGKLLDWPECKAVADTVRTLATEQLLTLWQRQKARNGDPFLWGDEVEGMLVAFDDANKRFSPCLRAAELAPALTKAAEKDFGDDAPQFHLEGADFDLEHTPGEPFRDSLADFLSLEPSLKARRQFVRSHLEKGQDYRMMTLFPRLGAREGTNVSFDRRANGVQRSQYLADDLLSPHARYQKFSANLRERRGSRMVLNVPIFRDAQTPWPFRDPTVKHGLNDWPEDALVTPETVKDNCIYGDSMLFGGSCCALQVTVQAKNIDEARRVHDQLLTLGPILLALTAATPMCKGYLADTDTRWFQIESTVDDRTPEERGIGGKAPLKPRAASNSTYLSTDKMLRPEYLVSRLPVNEDAKKRLLEGGMDELLATHFAHLFIRDPFIIFEKDMTSPDRTGTVHFDMLQTTNWQTVRFKPPPAPSTPAHGSGWRVELRSMEVQSADRENAAFVLFVVLMARVIVLFPELNFYVPISLVDENMALADKRDAVLNEKFHFRMQDRIDTFSIDEIINGHLLPLVRQYLDAREDIKRWSELEPYLQIVEQRATGALKTNARWQRDFVRSHPAYTQDSVVSERIAYDLLKAIPGQLIHSPAR